MTERGLNPGPADSSQTWRPSKKGNCIPHSQAADRGGGTTVRQEEAWTSAPQASTEDPAQPVPQLPAATPSCSRNAGCEGVPGTAGVRPAWPPFPQPPLPGSPWSEQFQAPQIPSPASKTEEAENFLTVRGVEGRPETSLVSSRPGEKGPLGRTPSWHRTPLHSLAQQLSRASLRSTAPSTQELPHGLPTKCSLCVPGSRPSAPPRPALPNHLSSSSLSSSPLHTWGTEVALPNLVLCPPLPYLAQVTHPARPGQLLALETWRDGTRPGAGEAGGPGPGSQSLECLHPVPAHSSRVLGTGGPLWAAGPRWQGLA